MSLPLRERELKCIFVRTLTTFFAVAPLEGAWIEIFKYSFACSAVMSLPLRERELKFCLLCVWNTCDSVAPYEGAWIEIFCLIVFEEEVKSFHARESELKFISLSNYFRFLRSLPVREPELKWCKNWYNSQYGRRRSLCGAWIEIPLNISHSPFWLPFNKTQWKSCICVSKALHNSLRKLNIRVFL